MGKELEMTLTCKDHWFLKYHYENLTPAFTEWWVGYYGTPEQYDTHPGELDDYWIRCGFALIGWLAREEKGA